MDELFRAIQTKLAPLLLAHKDPRASVATILRRLVEYGEVDVITDDMASGHIDGVIEIT